MTTKFLGHCVWNEITRALRSSERASHVAVAFFGQGACQQLPLSRGSCLVVNGSEDRVKCGETCPAELLKLLKRGVHIFNEPALHAKVFVVGKTAYVGSNNVSKQSANTWQEAAISTTEPTVVAAARRFVEDRCNAELGPEALKELQKLYRPPKIPGGGKANAGKKKPGSTLPRVFLAQLWREDWSEEEQELHDHGEAEAKRYRKHPRTWAQDDFCWVGNCPYKQWDTVVQVTDEGNGKFLVDAPGRVLYTKPPKRIGKTLVSFVYLEHRNQRRRTLRSLANALGCPQKVLRRSGQIRNQAFAQALVHTLGGLT